MEVIDVELNTFFHQSQSINDLNAYFFILTHNKLARKGDYMP